MALATVIIPTFDHGPLLRHSLGSVLAQSITDIEVLVIGDGVPDGAREHVVQAVAIDDRVSFIDRPKSPRTGEPYRHEALQDATGEYVFYLSDDDLWLPDHIERLLPLLERADFVNALPTFVAPDGSCGASVVDLSSPWHRARHRSGDSRISLTFGSHTMAAYRKLPHGWRTTPRPRYTDWYMWDQFLSIEEFRFLSSPIPTALHFSSASRKDQDLPSRIAEVEQWLPVLTDEAARRRFVELVLAGNGGPFHAAALEERLAGAQESWDLAQAEAEHSAREAARLHAQMVGLVDELGNAQAILRVVESDLAAIRASRTWRAHERLARIRRVAAPS